MKGCVHCVLGKLKFVCFLLLFYAVEGWGQFDAHFNQYWTLQSYYHPAHAGSTPNQARVYGSYAMQLMGFTRAPKSMLLGADMPFSLFNKQHGAGVGFFNEAIGLFRNQRFWGQYAYRLRWGRGELGIGAQAGMLEISFDPSNIDLGEDSNDDAFPQTAEKGTALDVGLGIYYTHARFYAGISGHHLTSPRVRLGERSLIHVKPLYYLTGGYNIQTRNPLVSIQPSLHLQTDLAAARLDLSGRIFYTHRSRVFSGGITYSPNTSVALSAGMTVGKISVGYTYEVFTSKIGVANGNHDVAVLYTLDLAMFKKNKNLHKSVRIL